MRTLTYQQIIDFIKQNKEARPHDLIQFLRITPAAVHRHLKKLCENGILLKIGRSPHVFYRLNPSLETLSTPPVKISENQRQFLEKDYLYIDPSGNERKGLDGFQAWARSIKEQNRVLPLIQEYQKTREEINQLFSGRVVNATERFKNIFDPLFLDKVFYQDFYSLPKFGKTRLGQWVLHGKQAQDKKIIRLLSDECKEVVEMICKNEKIDAIAWSPHSLPRKIPFLKELEKNLSLSLPRIEVVKAFSGSIPIAQKTLSKLEERIANARETIIIKSPKVLFKKILLIDDAVGSGATLNETAQKLKEKGAQKVVGFALVGSYKGFEVIREV